MYRPQTSKAAGSKSSASSHAPRGVATTHKAKAILKVVKNPLLPVNCVCDFNIR